MKKLYFISVLIFSLIVIVTGYLPESKSQIGHRKTLPDELDAWGYVRTATDTTFVRASGDTMTGALTLPGDPTEILHAVTREYVDKAVATLGTYYYMTDTDSGIEDYKLTQTSAPSGVTQSYVKSNLSDDDYILGWISSEQGLPNKLIAGVYDWRVYARKSSGNQTLRLYWKMIERKADSTEVIIATSINSNEILSENQSYVLPIALSEDYTIASDSYIVGKIYADVSGSGNAPEITLYYEGDSDSHWSIPTNNEILSDQFVNASGDTMSGDLVVDTIVSANNFQIDETPASSGSYSGLISNGTVGENVTQFTLLHVHSDGKYIKADADLSTTMPAVALAAESISANNSGVIILEGYCRNDSWSWTPGEFLYVSTASGAITATRPSGSGDQVQVIGYAVSSTVIYFKPDLTLVEIQ